jgi:spermidine synthase
MTVAMTTTGIPTARVAGDARDTRWPIVAVFVLSGAAGLVYEVVWARQLVLVFGNTTQAVSVILTGYFGGMAAGSYLGGRLADRLRAPLLLYGGLEILVAAVALVTPATFLLVQDVYRDAYGTLQSTPEALTLIRFLLCLAALGPATLLMGATLPTLTRYLTQYSGQLDAAFGRLYAANTIGAVIGSAVSGLVLIELLGLNGAVRVGVTCSAAAGVIALGLHWRRRSRSARPGTPATLRTRPSHVEEIPGDVPAPAAPVPVGASLARPRLAVAVAFVSGLTSLVYQTLWTRLLASGTGDLTSVFTVILTVFLIGLAQGTAPTTTCAGGSGTCSSCSQYCTRSWRCWRSLAS